MKQTCFFICREEICVSYFLPKLYLKFSHWCQNISCMVNIIEAKLEIGLIFKHESVESVMFLESVQSKLWGSQCTLLKACHHYVVM